jgi:hypothetical protein
MAWLGEEMEEKSEEALAPRCVKPDLNSKTGSALVRC